MSRARRLSEIAKANQPVFNSANGTEWWLADPSSKKDPQPAPPSDEAVPQPTAAHRTAVALQDAKPETSIAISPAPAPRLFQESTLQTGTNAALSTDAELARHDLASRLGSLKDKFRSLGRKNRNAEPE